MNSDIYGSNDEYLSKLNFFLMIWSNKHDEIFPEKYDIQYIKLKVCMSVDYKYPR